MKSARIPRLLAAALAAPTIAHALFIGSVDVMELGFEELMNIEVISASRVPEERRLAAAAVHVITDEAIRRSGATSIPEALRDTPGLHVAKIDSSKWVVSVRGFSDRFTNKLLVMMDGRSVYSPFAAGVYWDEQDTLLEDIDQIEVIRGPGGSLWGANAVNGVINILTKDAADTQGWLLSTGGGTEELGFANMRYGGEITEDLHYRIYGKWSERDGGRNDVQPDFDEWFSLRTGFRADYARDDKRHVTFQGDLYYAEVGQRQTSVRTEVEGDALIAGWNLLGRYQRKLSSASDFSLQAYYDHGRRDEAGFSQSHSTFDVDFQFRLGALAGHELLWGIEYRLIPQDFKGVARGAVIGTMDASISVTPRERNDQLFAGFAQDQFYLFDDDVRVTVGVKLEHNDYTGLEVQPTARLTWSEAGPGVLWGAISRAVRTPSRAETDLTLDIPAGSELGLPVRAAGNADLDASELIAFELGYRIQPLDDLSLDIASFYNLYDDISVVQASGLRFDDFGRPFILVEFGNGLRGEVAGVELSSEWVPQEWWHVSASYSYLDINLRARAGAPEPSFDIGARTSPRHYASLTSRLDLTDRTEFDLAFRYVDRTRNIDIEDWFSLDARLSWHASDHLELSLVGKSLLEDHHQEFSEGSEVEREVYGKLTWRF